MKKKIICFDVDNVICNTKNSNYKKSKPKKLAISKINELFKKGHKVILFTSRFMGRTKQNKKKSHQLKKIWQKNLSRKH